MQESLVCSGSKHLAFVLRVALQGVNFFNFLSTDQLIADCGSKDSFHLKLFRSLGCKHHVNRTLKKKKNSTFTNDKLCCTEVTHEVSEHILMRAS